MNGRAVSIVLGVVCAALMFQFFFRYQYIKEGAVVMRVDRVTGASCALPCIKFDPNSIPTPQPQSLTIGDTRAIQDARNQYDAISLINQWSSSNVYEWRIDGQYDNEYQAYNPFLVSKDGQAIKSDGSPATNMDYPIREVCYCNSKDAGWRWEVHLDTGEVFRIDGNANLEARYHLSKAKAW